MVITCGKCGKENPLGRIFCGQCGNKLDMSLSSSEIERLERPAWARVVAVYLGIGLGAVALIAVALALWPQKPFATGGKHSDSRKVIQRLNALELMMKSGSGGNAEFSQDELNAYLYHSKRSELKVESVSAVVGTDTLRVRMTRKSRPIKIGNVQLNPAMSYDLVVRSGDDGSRTETAAIGHLPLPGPAARPVVGMMMRNFEGKDRLLLDERTTMIAEEGRLILEVGTTSP